MNNINILEILGKNLHDIRFKKNISLRDLAKMVHIDTETLMKFEAGEYAGLGIKEYIKIANSLGISYEEITKGISFVKD